MNCHLCNTIVPSFARNCPVCQADVGFPNVRAAQAIEEQKAIDERLADAEVSARSRVIESELNNFGIAVLKSKAVIARNIGIVAKLVSSDTELYASFYQQVGAEVRLPEENPWDR